MKKYGIFILLAFAFLVGFIFSFLVYQGYWYRFVDGLKTVAWYMYFLMIIITFFVTLIIHELTHLFTFVFQGIKIRALYIHMLIMYRSPKGWRIKIKPKHFSLIGGFVVPNLPEIKDEQTYHNVIDKFRNALITAPYATIIFFILTILLWIVSIAFDFSASFIGFWSVFSLWTTIFSWLYMKSFKLSHKSFYGDFVAYDKMKNDDVFQLIQMVQYTGFSLESSTDTQFFLHQRITDMLVDKPIRQKIFDQILLLSYIDGVTSSGYQDHDIVHQKIKNYPVNPLFNHEQGVIVFYEIASYLYACGHVDLAYQRLDMIKEKDIKNVDQQTLLYLRYKYEHQLHMCYHDLYLHEHEDEVFKQQRLFEDLIDKKALIDLVHKPYPFLEWSTPIPFEEVVNENNLE